MMGEKDLSAAAVAAVRAVSLPDLICARDLAAALDCSERTARRLLKERIPSRLLGRGRVTTRRALLEWLEARP